MRESFMPGVEAGDPRFTAFLLGIRADEGPARTRMASIH
jgi:hypothetical protein